VTSRRIDPSWIVPASPANAEGNRCVDLLRRPDATFGFEEFRRDPGDAGGWTPVRHFAAQAIATRDAALAAARRAMPGLAATLH
jgi:hypothetical protein